jgi:hypothetical protein
MIEYRLVNSGPMCMPLTTLSGGAVKRDGPQAHTLADHGAADYTMSMDGAVYPFIYRPVHQSRMCSAYLNLRKTRLCS